MSNILIPAVVPRPMSSREIAELTGKEHRNAMRDLRVLKEQLGDMFKGSAQLWTHPQNGQNYEEFVVDKDTCLTLLLGYDAVARMKVVKRWQELENCPSSHRCHKRSPKLYAWLLSSKKKSSANSWH